MKLTRRTFLISGLAVGGGLAVGLGATVGVLATHDRRAHQAAGLDADGPLVALWIRIRPDSSVVVLSPHTEMGQGIHTGLGQIVAEELDVPWARVVVEQAPADRAFSNGNVIQGFVFEDEAIGGFFQRVIENAFWLGGDLGTVQMTGGSTSVRFTGWRSMRIAAAAARALLIAAAAARLGVPEGELSTADAQVVHAASGQALAYGELAEDAAALPVPQDPQLKDPAQYRHIGQSPPRADLPDKVLGAPIYGIDRAVPGMKHVAVVGTRALFGEVEAVTNEADILARRGVEAVVIVQEGVAVVADNPWRAEQAARAVRFTERPPANAVASSETLLAGMQQALAEPERFSTVEERGDVESVEGAVVEAEYFVPFLAHAPMEPPNVTLWREGDVVHAASGVQSPLGARMWVAQALGLPVEKVVFHPHTMGGGFGRRADAGDDMLNYITQACAVFQAVDQPIKLCWSREMDLRFDRYRQQSIARYRGVLGPSGEALAWQADSYGEINIPPDARTAYAVPHLRQRNVHEETFVPWAYWRSVEASIHCFYNECFIDELAHAAGADPLQYRLDHLPEGHRLRGVLEAARDMSGWQTGVAPDGTAMGVAAYALFGSACAQVARVGLVNGKPKVVEAWCALDCGTVIHPDAVVAQMEGGMIFGLTAALYGRIDIRDGGVVQTNFHDYRMVRMADAPRLHVKLVPDGSPPGGVGEVAVPHLSAAVPNALAVLGERPRRLPLIG
ncbi:MAG: xanthine dehydrogenase family protein molybdopterin-binding subunit [Alphaproteobacteria bacterium]|nr:xanthine dehydrogenase family protein molybdopterin-binding subunit [Alphaproteobacteria bacterium]